MLRFRYSIVPLSFALLSGCASFSERPAFPEYAGPPMPQAVQLVVSGKNLLQMGRDDWMEMPFSDGLAGVAADAIWNSGWVREATASDSVTEIRVYVVNYQGSGPGLLPTITAFLIPGLIDHRIDIEVKLMRAGGTTKHCIRSVETRTWYQTFLLFAYPFRSPAYGRIKSTEALALACLAELLDGDQPASSV